jgi:hypothetical protein
VYILCIRIEWHCAMSFYWLEKQASSSNIQIFYNYHHFQVVTNVWRLKASDNGIDLLWSSISERVSDA